MPRRILLTGTHQRMKKTFLSFCIYFFAINSNYAMPSAGITPIALPSLTYTTFPDHAIGCPAQNFADFIKTFASDPVIKKQFTANHVEVTELTATDEGEQLITTRVPRADYQGFNMTYANGSYHYVYAEGEVEPEPMSFEFKQETEGTYIAAYRVGSPESRLFRFQKQPDCWYLVAQPIPAVYPFQ